jgi:hypothetical protein
MKWTGLFSSAIAAIFLVHGNCTMNMAGNGSEVTNGTAITVQGPADSALVIAYPRNYVPMYGDTNTLKKTYTDSNGAFSLQLGDSAWNLLIYSRTGLGAFVPVNHDSALDTVKLDSLGTIQGIVQDSTIPFEYIMITGSPFFARLAPESTFVMTKVPPFTYEIRLFFTPISVCDSGQVCPHHADSLAVIADVRPNAIANIIIGP